MAEAQKEGSIYKSKDYRGQLNILRHERDLIVKALNLKKSNARAAKALQISERNMYFKMRRHRIIKIKNSYR